MLSEGKYTIEQIQREKNITRQSAINLISKLKKQNLLTTNGGGKQKRIYSISKIPIKQTNGFFDIVNKYSPEKLIPTFKHYTYGKYTIEHAIIDGIKLNQVRTLEATKYLFNHITNWKRLFDLAKKHNLTEEIRKLYGKARETIKCKRMPKRYEYD